MNPKLYWVPGSSHGRLAISARPRGGDWLENEVEGWRKQGVDIVVSLLTESENEELDLQHESGAARQSGLRFCYFPIQDRGVPNSISEAEQLARQLSSEIQQGKNVAIHCRQGIGRSSLIAATVLITRGEKLQNALADIREARGIDVPETVEQQNWLEEFAKSPAVHAIR